MTVEEIERILSYIQHFSKHESKNEQVQWRYRNPDTGVYFITRYDKERSYPKFVEWNESPLSFLTSLGRPHFFGLEIFPIISSIVKNLNLVLFDPQETATYKQPTKLTEEQLLRSWEKSNESKVESLLKAGKSVAFASREKMNVYWKYMKSRETLQDSVGSDVLVPTINLHKAKDGSVKMSCIWPDATKVVLPPVDFVFVQKEEKKFLHKKKVSGIVPFTKIVKMLKPRSEIKKDPVRHLLFDGPADNELLEDLSQIQLEPPDGYVRLSPSDVVDVKRGEMMQ